MSTTPASTPAPQATVRPTFWGTGRRKTAVARVRVLPGGKGEIQINKRPLEKYFAESRDRHAVTAALATTNTTSQVDVRVNVRGGGSTGQAGAILLGLARALVKYNAELEPSLRDAGFLTRDSREVERKKYGRRKARRRFQFSKR